MKVQQGLPPRTGRALDSLSLVKHHVLPLDPLKILFIRYDLRQPKP